MLSLPYSACGPQDHQLGQENRIKWAGLNCLIGECHLWGRIHTPWPTTKAPSVSMSIRYLTWPLVPFLTGEKSAITSICAWNSGRQQLQNCEADLLSLIGNLYWGYLMIFGDMNQVEKKQPTNLRLHLHILHQCARISLGFPTKLRQSLVSRWEKACQPVTSTSAGGYLGFSTLGYRWIKLKWNTIIPYNNPICKGWLGWLPSVEAKPLPFVPAIILM